MRVAPTSLDHEALACAMERAARVHERLWRADVGAPVDLLPCAELHEIVHGPRRLLRVDLEGEPADVLATDGDVHPHARVRHCCLSQRRSFGSPELALSWQSCYQH